MKNVSKWISGALILVATFVGADRAYAQEGAAGAGRAEITIVPVGGVFFTESKDASAPSFGNYQLGGSVAVNLNRFIGIEGEVGSTIGISQNLDFGYSNTVRTPDMLSYNGNVVVSMPAGSLVPYVTGGVGGLSVFAREALGVNETETRFATNVGGGLKWYAGRWGVRADYRFIALPSIDSSSTAFLSNEARYGHRVYGAILLNVGR